LQTLVVVFNHQQRQVQPDIRPQDPGIMPSPARSDGGAMQRDAPQLSLAHASDKTGDALRP